MNTLTENLFILPVVNEYLVYSPLNGISAMLNRAGIVELKKQIRSMKKDQEKASSSFQELAFDILYSPKQRPRRKRGSINPDFLGIIPTRECNGACNYCDFAASTASKERMTYEMAAGIVDWYIGICQKQKKKTVEIHFFGGEPMVASDVLEVVVHRTRLLAAEKSLLPYFEISTNGQYPEKKAQWLGNYFNKIVLSFDGSKDVHNQHRPLPGNRSSYENALATARIISNSQAELCIRCCVSTLNVSDMEEITAWCCEHLRLSAINFEILCETDITRNNGLYPPDPVQFALHFQHSREIASAYGIEAVYASDISEFPQVTSCPVGKDTVIVSPDGRLSSCYLLPERWQQVDLDLDVGKFDSSSEAAIESNKLEAIRNLVEDKPRCRDCFCKWSCAGGCHVGNTFPGCTTAYDDFCHQTRLISAFTLLSELDMKDKLNDLMHSENALLNLINQKSDKFDRFNA